MPERPLYPLVVATLCLALAGCSERTIAEAGDPEDEDPEVGQQPVGPGVMYSPCVAASECPDDLCVFPKDEAGYCAGPCAAPTDASTCDPAPGAQPVRCLDIGLPSGAWVCALDCADNPCPDGMRCEQISASDGARAVCF